MGKKKYFMTIVENSWFATVGCEAAEVTLRRVQRIGGWLRTVPRVNWLRGSGRVAGCQLLLV